jgi:hypothetical protein
LLNARRCASDELNVDIEMIIKIYGHFLLLAKRREQLKSFFDFVVAEWLEIVMISHCLSLTPADRLIQNWSPVKKSYIKSVIDCPKILKRTFQ